MENNLGMPGDRKSILAAASMFAMGFGALNVLYHFIGPIAPKPGLYDYYSSSFGDGFVLPAAAYLAECALYSDAPNSRKAGIVGGAVGGSLGILTQILWLFDPDPRLNWTLIAPGTFNIAGWYHALFLCCAMSYFGMRIGQLFIKALANTARALSKYSVGFVSMGTLFGALLLVDNAVYAGALSAQATTSVVFILGLVCLIAVFSLFLKHRIKPNKIK